MEKEKGSVVFSDWGMISSTIITDEIAEIVISFRRANGTGFGMFPEIALGDVLNIKSVTVFISFGTLFGSFVVTKKEAMLAIRSRLNFRQAVQAKVASLLRELESARLAQ